MEFLVGLIQYSIKYIFLIVVALCGIFAGKFIRDKKSQKN